MLDNKTIVIRLIVSFLLGGLIGIQRTISHKAAGTKTHIMVALGSTLTMLFGIYMSEQFKFVGVDPDRISAQVVSGIGFLGALCVFKGQKYCYWFNYSFVHMGGGMYWSCYWRRIYFWYSGYYLTNFNKFRNYPQIKKNY